MVLTTILISMNIRVDEAASGLRAIAKIREEARTGHYYRVIIMDMEMPEMDGYEATAAIRAHYATMHAKQEQSAP